jgi:hypothetical protein
MNAAEAPHALEDGPADGCGKLSVELGEAQAQMGAQEFQRTRDGDQQGDSVAADAVDHACGFELGLEVDFGGQQCRSPQAHELPEDVAQRKAVEEAKGMKGPLIAAIFCDLTLDGIEAREDIAMGVNYAFGFSSGAGSEDDLEGRIKRHGGSNGEDRLFGEANRQFVEGKMRKVSWQQGEMCVIGKDQPWDDIGNDAGGEFSRAGGIKWNGENAAQKAAEEGCDPLGGIITPKHDTLSGSDTAPVEFSRKSSREGG